MADVKNNIIELDAVVKKLNKSLDENINRLILGAKAVQDYSRSFSNIPSQYLKLLSDLADKNKALQETQKRLIDIEKELDRLRQRQITTSTQRNQRTSEEIVNQRELARASDTYARSTSALLGAYANLNAQHQIASRRLQDLVARGRLATQTQSAYNTELREAQTAFDRLNQRVLSADRAVGRFNRNVGNYPTRAIAGIRDLIGAFGIVGGVSLFALIAKDVFETTKELQSLDNALRQVSGTQEQMARSQEFLRSVSEDYGLEIKGLTKQFTQFYVSAKDKLSATQIENIFRSVSKAGATMGLSVENQERAFLALNQMMSKGTIQAEELRGQLGEALPGAFGIMAKAVGVTEKELQKMMKAGDVLADEVLPKFAEQLEKVYGIETINRVETLTASQNRLANSWTEMVRSLNESETGGISQFFKFIVDGLNDVLSLLIRVNTSWDDLWKQAGKKGKEAGKAFFEAQINENSGVKLTAKQRALINQRIDEIKDMFVAGYNDPNLQKELDGLYKKLAPSKEFNAESLGNTASKNVELFTNKVSKLNDELKKTEEQSYVGNVLKRMVAIDARTERAIKADIEKAQFDLAYWKQVSESAENFGKTLDVVTEKENKLTAAKKANVKIEKEEEILIIGTEAWLKRQISLLEEKRSKTADTSEEYAVGTGAIKFYQQWLERLVGTQKKSNKETEKTLKYGTIPYYEDLIRKTRELQELATTNQEYAKLESQIKFYQELVDEIKGTTDATKDLEKATNDYFNSFIDNFSSESGFSKTLDILRENIKDFGKDAKTTALAVSEAFQEAFNTISESSQANFEAEYNRLSMQKEFAIQFAGESTTAKEEIERQYEEKRKAIARREAEAQKRLAIFNIAIDTAQAVVAALPNIPLSVAIGVIGAAQIAMVNAQEIPQFWRGTENAPEGWAITQEKGAEVIKDKYGKVKSYGSDKGAQMTYLNKGDKVYNAQKSEAYINKELAKNGIMPMHQSITNYSENKTLSKDDFNNGISKLAKTFKNQQPASNTQVFLNNKRINTDYFKGKKV